MLTQLIGVVVTIAWSGVVTFVILKVVGVITPLRVTPEAEQMGLDITPARRVDPLLMRPHAVRAAHTAGVGRLINFYAALTHDCAAH